MADAGDQLPNFIEVKLRKKKELYEAANTPKGGLGGKDAFKNLTKQQIESVSKSILQGTRSADALLREGSNTAKDFSDNEAIKFELAKSLVHANRHWILKSKFLQLQSTQASITPINPKELHKKEVQKLRSYRGRKPQNFAFSDPFGESKLDENSIHSSGSSGDNFIVSRTNTRGMNSSLSSEQTQRISYAITASKKTLLEKNKREIKELKSVRERIRDEQAESVIKRQQVMRKLTDFRKKIAARLEETKNPNATMIMRCIDDSLIHDFLEKFKGYSMSVDAIIVYMVESLGNIQSGSTSFKIDQFFENSGEEYSMLDRLLFFFFPPKFPVQFKKKKIEFSAAATILGPSAYGVRTGTFNQVSSRSYSPTASSGFHSLSPPKVLGSGFRSSSQPLSPPKTRIELINEYSINSKKIDNQRLKLTRSKENSVEVDGLPLLSPTAKSIIAVRNQLVAEGNLPSLQPEIQISDAQITQIGKHEMTVDQVIKSVIRNRNKSKRLNENGTVKDEWVVDSSGQAIRVKTSNNNRPPRMLKTDDKTLLHVRPMSPYSSFDEEGRIMSSGVASGAGLSIKMPPPSRGGTAVDKMDESEVNDSIELSKVVSFLDVNDSETVITK